MKLQNVTNAIKQNARKKQAALLFVAERQTKKPTPVLLDAALKTVTNCDDQRYYLMIKVLQTSTEAVLPWGPKRRLVFLLYPLLGTYAKLNTFGNILWGEEVQHYSLSARQESNVSFK